MTHIDILFSMSGGGGEGGKGYLPILKALYIQELEPEISTKDEYRSRTLTIKI